MGVFAQRAPAGVRLSRPRIPASVSPGHPAPGSAVDGVAGAMTPEAFRDALKAAGIEESKPLYPVLMTVWEAAETARAAAADGARGLTAEGERALIDKVGGEVAAVAERKVERLVGRLDLRRALQLAVL